MISRTAIIFDEQNKDNIKGFCKWTGIISSAFLLLMFIIVILTPFFGLGISHAIYRNTYNMSTGQSYIKNYSHVRCYNDFDFNVIGNCWIYGFVGIIVIIGFGLLCVGPIYLLLKHIEDDKKILHGMIGGVITVVLLYIATMWLGLFSMNIIYDKSYNMTTGWPLDNNVTGDRLICYIDLTGSLLMSCLLPGMFAWIVMIIIIIIGVLLFLGISIMCAHCCNIIGNYCCNKQSEEKQENMQLIINYEL